MFMIVFAVAAVVAVVYLVRYLGPCTGDAASDRQARPRNGIAAEMPRLALEGPRSGTPPSPSRKPTSC